MTYILGIDAGTQSVKTGLLRLDAGTLEHTATRGYPSGAEQPPGALWTATLDAVSETVQLCGRPRDIAGVGLSGQMHGTVLFGEDDDVIGNIINWQDDRCDQPLVRHGGRSSIDRMLELMPAAMQEDLGIDRMASGFMGATLFYLKENDPGLFGRVRRALFPTDYIRRLIIGGGDYVTDPTNAFGAGVFDTRRGCWHEGILSALGLPQNLFPEVRPTHNVAGTICDFVAHRTGLRQGTPVVVGGGDNLMAMLGCGAATAGGPLCVNIGTSSQLCAVTDTYTKIPGIDTRTFFGGRFALVYAGLTGGKSYTWLKNMLLADLVSLQVSSMPIKDLFAVMDALASKIPTGCDGLRFEPMLRGTRRNPARRGAFTGVSEKNFSLGHRARAVLEGVVCELSEVFQLMNLSGGGALAGAGNGLVRSALWRQITADVFGMTLKVTDFENAVQGAALVAAHGLGLQELTDSKIQYAHEAIPR